MNLVGRTLGKYHVEKLIGHGSMSVCYRATNTALGNTVALKVLAPEYRKNALMVSVFHEKAQLGAKLDHPNSVRFHDLVVEGDDLFIVMEFVEGEKLGDIIENKGPLDVASGLHVLSGICDALEYAHQNGVIHYNLKPHNIIIEPNGNPVVIDYGMALAALAEVMPEHYNSIQRVRYFSPEAIRRENVDYRTDLWSMGITAYYVFTGRFPFEGEDVTRVREKILSTAPVKTPSSLKPHLPYAIDIIIEQLLSKDPKRRYISASHLREDLDEVTEQVPGAGEGADTALAEEFNPGLFGPLASEQQTNLGNYRLLERKGAGSFANVYMAEDRRSGRLVALKLLKQEFEDQEEVIGRFEQEAEFARRIRHPNVVDFYEFGVEENLMRAKSIYFTMEYIEGPRLKDLINPGEPMPLPRALDITRQVCLGLCAAHELGIIHRDLKPANILLDKTGRALIADFGIAVARFVKNRLTATGQLLGTYTYMSPEQANGEEVTPASDLYSLGVILYEMITGVLPFEEGPPLVTLKQIVEETPAEFPDYLHVPEDVRSLNFRLLQKMPEDRFDSSCELRKALEEICAAQLVG